MAAITDGFELARADLELRREGDVLGAMQSGRRSGLEKARAYAGEIVAQDPGLRRHRGLADLVGRTVGDEERAAWLGAHLAAGTWLARPGRGAGPVIKARTSPVDLPGRRRRLDHQGMPP